MYDTRYLYSLHGDANNTVRGVPEADVSRIGATLGRPPGHNQDEDLDKVEEKDSNVPSSEVAAIDTGALAASAEDVDTDGHGHVEHGRGVGTQTHDCTCVSYVFLCNPTVGADRK